MAKWFACYIALNSSDFLRYSLSSIYNFIKKTGGKIIIIEGCNEWVYRMPQAAKYVTPEGLSTDNTEEIIKEFSHEGVVIHKKVGFQSGEALLRQKYFDTIAAMPQAEQPDWIISIDDDELFIEKNLDHANQFVSNHPYLEYLYTGQYGFIADFKHIFVINGQDVVYDYKLAGNWKEFRYDVTGKLVCMVYQIKLFKWFSGMRYGENASCLISSDGKDMYGHPYYEEHRIAFDGCPWYHFSGLRPIEKKVERLYYGYGQNGPSLITQSEEEFAKTTVIHCENELMGKIHCDPKIRCRVEPFMEEYPPIIKTHPRFNEEWLALNDIKEAKKKYGIGT